MVAGGNEAQDFSKKGPKIVIILDNASFHKTKIYLDQIETEMTNIHLEFRNCSKTAEKNIKTAGKSVNRKAGTT